MKLYFTPLFPKKENLKEKNPLVFHFFFLKVFFAYNCQAFSEKGYVKRMKPDTFNLQNRGTIGKSVGKLRVNDAMSDFIVCRAHDHVLYFRYFISWLSYARVSFI